MSKTSISAPRKFLAALLLGPAIAAAGGTTEFGGHTKLAAVAQRYPSDSVFREIYGSDSRDIQGDLRLKLEHRTAGWTLTGDYQLVAFDGDTFRLPDDGRRLFDFTSVIDSGGDSALLHRLDRLWVGYASEKAVVRVGRQALSWGNGLFYVPMDLVNPFNPAAIDTEYKAGDDMLYFQYLLDTGADIQAAYVARRDILSGDAGDGVATFAVKYHGFAGEGEFDLLVARHYGDTVVGVGAGHSIGEAHWSGDLVVTDTDRDTYLQVSTNLSYSWVWAGKNVSALAEYHFNGFGQRPERYAPQRLANNPDLLSRLGRGESFTIGRHYVAGSILVEVTPLFSITPTLLANVGDPSGLFQFVVNYSLSDNMTLLGSLNVPFGGNGSEFGGTESSIPNRYLSTDAGVFAQFAWYF